jgi:exopolysaccharide biosynthesis polyprenyl glycosylphosphotransferase
MVSQTSEVHFQVHRQGNQATVSLPGRLSILEAVAFKTTCHQLIDDTPPPQEIRLDFGQTTFIDSSGIGALISVVKTAKAQEIQLILQRVNSQVMAVFSLTSLDQVLTIEQPTHETVLIGAEPINKQLPMTHPSVKSWIKRMIDIVGSLVGLAITGVLFIPVAIAIKLDSHGPIFFGQIRCGWMGKNFRMWKFRSMDPDAESRQHEVENEADGGVFKNSNDPRVTRVGRLLRRTSLDELPQFWNVLTGEMSLVGTRPPTADEVERYEVPQWQRLDVKPGMTGEWQVNGRSEVKSFEDIIRLDLKYQENWSLMYDIKLIIKTVLILFRKNSGAM